MAQATARAPRKSTAAKATKVDPPKVDDMIKDDADAPAPAIDTRPADEREPGGPERTVDQALRSAAAEAPPRSRRARRQAAVADATDGNAARSGKLSVAEAAAILRIYESEVASVDKTDQGIVATTTDGQHYLLLEDGFVWLEQPEQQVGR